MMLPTLDPQVASGPIPGENFTSNEKNYPWHRPPDYTDIDSALEKVVADFEDDPSVMHKYMSFLSVGIPVTTVTDIIVTKGLSQGYWTVDFGILLAGPIAKILTIIAKTFDVKYELGIEEELDYPTTAQLELSMKRPDKQEQALEQAQEEIDRAAEQSLSLMGLGVNPDDITTGMSGVAPPEEQDAMLGNTEITDSTQEVY
jgi:hypothetical protein